MSGRGPGWESRSQAGFCLYWLIVLAFIFIGLPTLLWVVTR